MTSGPAQPQRRPDGSMSLLVDMMTNSLDSSYAEAARRRTPAPAGQLDTRPDRHPGVAARRGAAMLLILGLGLLTGTAAAQVRHRQASIDGVRARLVSDVRHRVAESDALSRQAASLRTTVDRERTAGLSAGATGRTAAQQLAELELAAGVVPVSGSGLVIHLDDAPTGSKEVAARGGTPGAGRVLDRDLQAAVNGVWAAGAEAVAVNGLRLTARTAIRSAGEAILVDYRPVSPPYTVRAVGDPARLELAFRDGVEGRQLASLASLYGLRLQVDRSRRQTLPAPGPLDLRLAQPLGGPP